jgi:hypothetical protein
MQDEKLLEKEADQIRYSINNHDFWLNKTALEAVLFK